MVAGDPEWRMEAERRVNGFPIASGNWDMLIQAKVDAIISDDPAELIAHLKKRGVR